MDTEAVENLEATKNPTVTVITVTFNSGDALRKCWTTTTWPDGIDWIVVDNASTDDSVIVAEELGAKVISLSKNQGFSYANNVGAAATESQVLLFANPDLMIDAHDIPGLAKLALKAGGIVAPQLLNSDGSAQENGRQIPYLHRKLKHMFGAQDHQKDPYLVIAEPGEILDAVWVMGAAIAISRSSFTKLGGWDPRFFIYYEDHDFGLRARKNGLPVKIDGNTRWRHGWARETSKAKSLKPWRHEIGSALKFYARYPWAFLPIWPPPKYARPKRKVLRPDELHQFS